MGDLRLAEIRIYPVKALAGAAWPAAEVEPWGLRGDRVWLVVDAAGRFLTQREHAGMALIAATATASGLLLEAPGAAALEVAAPGAAAPVARVTVWRDVVPARVAAPAAHAWLSEVLGVACRLVYLADRTARPIDPAYAQPGESVSFADGFPLLLTTLASLAELNASLALPVSMDRFRANLVVAGAAAWAEDGWRQVRVGEVVLRVVKPCARCVVTTIDPATGARPDRAEPLRTLAALRPGVTFGQNLIPAGRGVVRLGDAVEVLG
jgi:uncharacterized protein YcbX